MNDQTLVYYITQLQQQIQQLTQQVHSLTQRVQKLEQQHPAKTSIEKLEYHFDQLKIERLDGTLHIGVTPEDLQSMDEFAVSPSINHPQASVQQLLESHIDHELPAYIQSLEKQYHYPLESNYRQALITDLKQQLPSRISHYQQANMPPQELPQHIVEQVKAEMQHGLNNWFIQQQKE